MPLPLINLRDCTEKCKSKQHGELIISALTKRAVTDSDLCSYLDYVCCCCDTVKDEVGQTALHMSASCGRTDVVKWLTQSRRANINLKDCESGFTPLHKSIFYGKIDIAVQLIKLGANLTTTDFDGFTSLENAMLDLTEWKELMNTYSQNWKISELEVYVWGSNANYTIGPKQERNVPERLDIFHRQNPSCGIKQICLEKFHCVILTSSGEVFASGHGHGGRLGFESGKTVIVPKKVTFSARSSVEGVIKSVSISIDHTIFLAESGHIWTCGLNSHRVLGIRSEPESVLTPHQLPLIQQHHIEGVLAAKYHSVAWGPTAVYTWGLNGGQLGHHVTLGTYVKTPRLVAHFSNLKCDIINVRTSNAAIAVLTSNKDIFVLHDYLCSKIVANHLAIRSFTIIGGKISTKLDHNELIEENQELIITVNTILNNLHVWRDSWPSFHRCMFSTNRCFSISQVTSNLNEILFVTTFGEAYRATFKSMIKKTNESEISHRKNNFHRTLNIENYYILKATKIPNIHRALVIESDMEGKNFACLQVNPAIVLNKAIKTTISKPPDELRRLLLEATEDDYVHDVIFKVAYRLFPAHHYIIASKSNYLDGLIKSSNGQVIELFNIEPLIFEQLLLYIYTNTCDLTQAGPLPTKFKLFIQSLDEMKNNEKSLKDPIRMLQEVSKRFEFNELHQFMKKIHLNENFIVCKNDILTLGSSPLSRLSFPNLLNVTLRTKDDKTIKVHKCILVAKMEYFNNFFSVRWKENSEKTEISFPYSYYVVEDLMEYLYTDELSNLNKKDFDSITNLLVLADEFFLDHMKDLCESALISHITLKNVATVFSFSHIYNANHLKTCCMRLMCYNLPAVLESRSLEVVDDDLLHELTEYYSDFNPKLRQRIITPYLNAPPDELLFEIAKNNPISIDSDGENCIKAIAKQRRKRLRSKKSGSWEPNKADPCLSSTKPEELVQEVNNLSLNKVESSPNLKEESFTKVQMRVKALVAARETVKLEIDQSNFEKLGAKAEFSLTSFPELNDYSTTAKSFSKNEKVDFKQKMSKLSQKQRKRLSSESSVTELSTSPVAIETPKNPWKIASNNNTPDENIEYSFTMKAIITEEIKQKENFIRMKTKLLSHTQIEDKAIDDLRKFYNVDNISDEVITVNRVQTSLIASPVWVPIKK